MKRDLPLYHISRVIEETGEHFEDGTHIIYVNGEHDKDDTPLSRLMHDFKCVRSQDMVYPQLADGVRYYKETEGGRETMCKIVEEIKNEAAEKAAHMKQLEMAKALIDDGTLPFEKIAKCSGLTLDEVKSLAEGKPA